MCRLRIVFNEKRVALLLSFDKCIAPKIIANTAAITLTKVQHNTTEIIPNTIDAIAKPLPDSGWFIF